MHFLQDPLKAYIFYPNRFFYVLPKKPTNKHLLATRGHYILFKTIFCQVNNKGIVLVIHPLNWQWRSTSTSVSNAAHWAPHKQVFILVV